MPSFCECARVSFVNWHHVFIEFTPQALVWLKTTTQQQMSTQNSKQYVYFFLRQNELSFKQKVCFTCFLPKFCMRHLLNGLASHFLLSSPLPFSQALLTSAVRGVTSGMKVQNDSCLNLTFIFLFPNISHQIAPPGIVTT